MSDATPQRLADIAVRLRDHLGADQPDASARWLCGELPDPLDRWRLTFMLARLAVSPGESPASLLKRMARNVRRAT